MEVNFHYFFIAKGKTMRATYKLDCPSPHVVRPTESGWCRETVLNDYLEEIILQYTGSQPCLLILDCYTAHINWASTLNPQNNIEIAFVPACMTSTLSPLDVIINPTVKAIGKGKFRQMCVLRTEEECLEGGTGKWKEACHNAIESFDQIKSSTVTKAFEKAIGNLSNSTICEQKYKEIQERKQREEERRSELTRPIFEKIDEIMNDFNGYMHSHH